MSQQTPSPLSKCVNAIDTVQGMLDEAKGAFGMKLVKPEAIVELLNTLKVSMPDEIKEAGRIIAAQDDIVNNAQANADKTIADANANAKAIGEQAAEQLQLAQTTLQNAQAQAEQTIAAANADAEQTHAKALQDKEDIAEKAQQQAEAIIAQAQQQAASIVAQAEAQAADLVSKENVLVRAQMQAQQLMADTTAKATELRTSSYEYADKMLGKLEAYANDILTDVHTQRQSVNEAR